MASIPSRVSTRIANALKKYQPILETLKSKDVGESDTVIIVNDLLHDLFGYDKYTEVTSEHAIKGTFVDLAVKIDEKITFLVEIKAIGLEMKDSHVKQAVDYGANLGVEWVVLTIGHIWRIYRISYGKPIDAEVVCEFNLLTMSTKVEDHLELLWLLTKEGWQKKGIDEYHTQRRALDRFCLAALIRSESVLKVITRELKRMAPKVKLTQEEIEHAICHEVVKRELLEGDKAEAARKSVAKASRLVLRKSSADDDDDVAETIVGEAAAKNAEASQGGQ